MSVPEDFSGDASAIKGVPPRVLAIYAHPDDAEVSCGATLTKWRAGGSTVRLVVATRGEKGTQDPSVSPEELAKTRQDEMRAADEHLGIEGRVLLGYGDGEIENSPRLREQLVRLIRKEKPTVVMCPDPTAVFFGSDYFNHRDHRELGWAVMDSVSPASGSPHYFPACGPAHQVRTVYMSGTMNPDIVIDVSGYIKPKVAAIASHVSQIGSDTSGLESQVAARAQEIGRPAGFGFGECFRILRISHGRS